MQKVSHFIAITVNSMVTARTYAIATWFVESVGERITLLIIAWRVDPVAYIASAAIE